MYRFGTGASAVMYAGGGICGPSRAEPSLEFMTENRIVVALGGCGNGFSIITMSTGSP